MKAAVIEEKGRIRLKEVERPVLCSGEALIKVKYCGICGSDVHVLKGEHPTAEFPVIPGHEFVGELVEWKGRAAEALKIGDSVVAQPFFSCGNCEPCAKGRDNVCEHLYFLGAHTDGGMAEYVKVPLQKVYRIPEDMDPKLAALTEPVAVAVHDVRMSGLQVGGTVLVIGGGPIGILIAIVARHAGARRVVISEISEFRRRSAEELGFETVSPLEESFDMRLEEATDQKGFDVCFEVSGSRSGVRTAVDKTKITGTVMIIGMTTEPYPVDLSLVFQKELQIQGVRIHGQYHFIGAVELLKEGALNGEFASIISRIYSLDQIEEAFALAQAPGDYFKILVEM